MDGLTLLEREVLVYNQPKQKFFTFKTATNKWSDIADLIIKQAELECPSLNNMKAVLQSNKSTLELPEALIPTEGAQKIFLFEAKVKSGAVDYNKLSFTDLRRLAKSKGVAEGLGSNPSKKQLIDVLETAAEIRKEKISKTGKTGKTTSRKVVTASKNTESIKKADKQILETQPDLVERVQALEGGFANFVEKMYALCSDYVKPTIAPIIPKEAQSLEIGDVDLAELNKEAKALTVR